MVCIPTLEDSKADTETVVDVSRVQAEESRGERLKLAGHVGRQGRLSAGSVGTVASGRGR